VTLIQRCSFDVWEELDCFYLKDKEDEEEEAWLKAGGTLVQQEH